MLPAILTLLGCQLLGEILRTALALPIPGPVTGMFILAAVLAVRGRVPPGLEATADALISHMGLLFVPAGVGIVAEAGLLRQQWLPIAAAVVASTWLSLVVTGWVMHAMLRRSDRTAIRSPGRHPC